MREKRNIGMVVSVKDKAKLKKMLTTTGYTNIDKFIWDAVDNHVQLHERIDSDHRLAIVKLSEYGTTWEVDYVLQPLGFNYEEADMTLN